MGVSDWLMSIYCQVFYKLQAHWTILAKRGLFGLFGKDSHHFLFGMLPKTPKATTVTVESCVDSCPFWWLPAVQHVSFWWFWKEEQRPSVQPQLEISWRSNFGIHHAEMLQWMLTSLLASQYFSPFLLCTKWFHAICSSSKYVKADQLGLTISNSVLCGACVIASPHLGA